MPAMLYLPSGYKNRTNRTVDGIARTGEISPKGTVAHIEGWDGRLAAEAGPTPMHYAYSVSTGEVRPLTFAEMVERGYFIIAKGPVGHVRQGVGQTPATRGGVHRQEGRRDRDQRRQAAAP